MRYKFILLFHFLIVINILGQISLLADEIKAPVQNIKGSVLNSRNHQPIQGASVYISESKFGAYTKSDGSFRIASAPSGRHRLIVSAVGFEPQHHFIVVTSGKEFEINIELVEKIIQTGTVEVTAQDSRSSFASINEASIVSVTRFTVDDVERYAGSRMDPARMAQNYAGVLGNNDQRNDIIIRGGSPTELLWRLDGLDIPNPNHFATQGATGGPISAINSNILDNSDFLTGALPAEYGDKLSGAFDLKTRRGNKDNYEFIGQFGFNGFEIGAEGPAGFQQGSFIVNYRYSFLDILDQMGVDFGFAGIPRYQDGTVKFDCAFDNNNRISFTGLFGLSEINILESRQKNVFTGDMDIINGTDFFAGVINLQTLFSVQAFGTLTIGANSSKFKTELDSITTDEQGAVLAKQPWLAENSAEGFYTIKYALNYSPEASMILTGGVELRERFYNLSEKRFTPDAESGLLWNLEKRGSSLNVFSWLNMNYRISEELIINAGLQSQYLELNHKGTIEPRVALSYRTGLNTFSAGFGVHRQSLPLLLYFSSPVNEKLDFMQSLHYVAGWQRNLSEDAMVKVEGYYKDISKAPVEAKSNAWSFLNSGTNFGSVFYGDSPCKSEGLGKVYGIELTALKQFSKGYYITATGTYYRQQYRGSDNIWRWGAFDNQYIINFLAGYEWKISPFFTIESSIRYTHAGGARYTPVDIEKSSARNATYFIDSLAFSLRMPDYKRFDLRLDFRHNMRNLAVIGYFSIENLFNINNTLMFLWDSRNKRVKTVNQLGVFPVGGVRVEF